VTKASDVDHTAYGLAMRDGSWRGHCGCAWESELSPDLATATDHLDSHLRAVVADEQRPRRLAGLSAAVVLQLVDHTLVLGMMCALAVGVAGSVLSRAEGRG
jgi:hypothetical protein